MKRIIYIVLILSFSTSLSFSLININSINNNKKIPEYKKFKMEVSYRFGSPVKFYFAGTRMSFNEIKSIFNKIAGKAKELFHKAEKLFDITNAIKYHKAAKLMEKAAKEFNKQIFRLKNNPQSEKYQFIKKFYQEVIDRANWEDSVEKLKISYDYFKNTFEIKNITLSLDKTLPIFKIIGSTAYKHFYIAYLNIKYKKALLAAADYEINIEKINHYINSAVKKYNDEIEKLSNLEHFRNRKVIEIKAYLKKLKKELEENPDNTNTGVNAHENRTFLYTGLTGAGDFSNGTANDETDPSHSASQFGFRFYFFLPQETSKMSIGLILNMQIKILNYEINDEKYNFYSSRSTKRSYFNFDIILGFKFGFTHNFLLGIGVSFDFRLKNENSSEYFTNGDNYEVLTEFKKNVVGFKVIAGYMYTGKYFCLNFGIVFSIVPSYAEKETLKNLTAGTEERIFTSGLLNIGGEIGFGIRL